MTASFADKAIIVTGASSGLGRAIALERGAAGADIWRVGRSATELDETAHLITSAGGRQALLFGRYHLTQ